MTDVSLRALTAGQLAERRAAEEIRRRYTEQPPSIWTLVYDGFDPARQELREALCAYGGKDTSVARDALPSGWSAASTTWGHMLWGCDRLVSDDAGRDVENEDLINARMVVAH